MNTLTAEEIIRLLEEPTDHRYPIKLRVTKEAPSEEFVLALQQANTPLTRQILCDIAGDRLEQVAVPDLIKFLQDPSLGVRASCADALGKIGDPKAGPALFGRFAGEEQEIPVLTTLALGLGAVGYRAAIPLLIEALEGQDATLCSCAAWSLGLLGAVEARGALRAVLIRESALSGSDRRMEESLEALETIHKVNTTLPRREAIIMLLSAIKQKPLVVVRFTSATWALGELGAREARAPLKRLLVRYPKGFLAEAIKASLLAIEEKNP